MPTGQARPCSSRPSRPGGRHRADLRPGAGFRYFSSIPTGQWSEPITAMSIQFFFTRGLSRIQRYRGGQMGEVAPQRAHARGIVGGPCCRLDRRRRRIGRRIGIHACRLVPEHARRQRRFGLRAEVQFDLLVGDPELRFLDHHAIHPHPAASDVQLRLAAGARKHRGEVLGQADGVGHWRLIGLVVRRRLLHGLRELWVLGYGLWAAKLARRRTFGSRLRRRSLPRLTTQDRG